MKLGLTTTSRSVPRPQPEAAAINDAAASTDRPVATGALGEPQPVREEVHVPPAASPSSRAPTDVAPESASVLESTTKLIRREALTGTGRHAKAGRGAVPPAAASSSPVSERAPASSRGEGKPPSERRRPRK